VNFRDHEFIGLNSARLILRVVSRASARVIASSSLAGGPSMTRLTRGLAARRHRAGSASPPIGGDMHYMGPILRHHVRSSAVRSIGYDEGDWVLQVEFHGGKVYNYFRVPPDEYVRLMNADSIGTHVNRQIKPYYEFEEEDGTDE
jgi:hypothetical protein